MPETQKRKSEEVVYIKLSIQLQVDSTEFKY